MQRSLDIRIPFIYEDVSYLAPANTRNQNADLQLPDGTLLRVETWEGLVVPRIVKVVKVTADTARSTILKAVVAETKPTAAPPGALN